MDDPSIFAAWLKQRRKALDLTQNELALAANCSLVTIKKIEAGDLKPSKQLAESLAAMLRIPATEQTAFIEFARGKLTIFQSQAIPVDSPPSASIAPAYPRQPYTRLPAQMTAVFGRERETAAGVTLLRQPGVRLVTLTGPPGTGKTRLSLEIAQALQTTFPDGVCFVPLAPVSQPDLVLNAIAAALGIVEERGAALLVTLQAHLRSRTFLLVLDNFEQVVDAAVLVKALLVEADGLKVLVSSREPLHIYGEHEFPVPPLALPDVNRLPPLEALILYPAIELFVERAKAVQPLFALTTTNAAAIAHICAWLDGLPLAIEMAAAQIKWLSPQNVLAQLRGRLTALTGGLRDLTPRQQTLRGAIDWSYNLLAPDECRLFIHLSVFMGGCTVAAAEAVLGEQTSLLPLLHALIEKNLLRHTITPAGDLRFWMLAVMREYAQERLEMSGAAATARSRHAAYYQAQVVLATPELNGAQQVRWLNLLEADHNNLRAALEWYLQHDLPQGFALATMLAEGFWVIRGHFGEGRAWFEKLLAQAASESGAQLPAATHAAALRASVRLALGQGDLPTAAALAQASLTLFEQIGDQQGKCTALRMLASVALHQSNYAQAIALYQQALTQAQAAGDQAEAAAILNGLGLVAKDQGDYARAAEFHQQSYARYQALNDQIGMARSLMYLSIVAYWRGDYRAAAALAQQCVTLQSERGDSISIAFAREIQAMAVAKTGDLAQGMHLLEKCLEHFQSISNKSGLALILNDMGLVAHWQGNYAQAIQLHQQGLQAAWQIGDKRRMAFCLEGIAMACGQWAAQSTPQSTVEGLVQRYQWRAIQLFGAVAALRTQIGAPLPPTERADYEASLAQVRVGVNPATFAATWAKGEAMSLEQAVAYAAEATDSLPKSG